MSTTDRRPTRREALRSVAAGMGALAFSDLATLGVTHESLTAPAAKARRVIFLCMRGGPSHVDTFDYKPALARDHGKTGSWGKAPLMKSPWTFEQRGKSGLWISDLFPEIAKHADSLCLLRGMHCDQPSHAQAFVQMHTGTFQFVRPSMGSWILYGLGSESKDLPGYVSINPPTGVGGAQNYGNAFLPTHVQGTRFQIEDSSQRNRRIDRLRRGEPNPDGIRHVRNEHLDRAQQKAQLRYIRALNEEMVRRERHAPLAAGAVKSFDLAYRMQDAVPGIMNIDSESEGTLRLYGIGDRETEGFGRQCLLARRFAEAGVRFIELGHGSWDQHSNLSTALKDNATATDRPIAGLLTDLAQRGLLKDTLVIWGGEFGRSPHSSSGNGRDHNHRGFTTWMAGAGVKRGFSFGATDDHGYEAVDGRMHIRDWHATILHLLGLDHEKLTFRHASRDMRLTDTGGTVMRDVIA